MRQCVFLRHLVAVALTVVVESAASTAWADPGLLLIAHGAPRPEWNAPVLEFGRKVAEEAKRTGRFKAVRTAMLEAVQPDVPTSVAELETEGCDRIVAVPLFIAPTGHTLFDVPAVLGNYSSPEIKAALAKEGGAVARSKVPITLTQTLDEAVLSSYALDQVRKLSNSPADEAIVLLAHGDEDHHRLVDGLLRRIATYCCGRAGIDYGDWAYVEVGQSYLKEGVPAIMKAAAQKKRVLVVGLYVSSSAMSIHQRGTKGLHSTPPAIARFFKGHEVAFSKEGVVAHPDALGWVLKAAQSALEPPPTPAPRTPEQTASDVPALEKKG